MVQTGNLYDRKGRNQKGQIMFYNAGPGGNGVGPGSHGPHYELPKRGMGKKGLSVHGRHKTQIINIAEPEQPI